MSLKKRIQILLAFLVGLPLVFLLAETYRAGRRTLLAELRREAVDTARLQAATLEQAFENPRLAVEGLVRTMESAFPRDRIALAALLRRTLEQTPEVFGMSVVLLPLEPEPWAPYIHRGPGGLVEKSLGDPAYALGSQAWLQQPLATRRASWTDPYLDRGGGEVPMITLAAPVLREGRVVAVVTADVALAEMEARLRQLKPGGEGQAYLVNRQGAVFAHPERPVWGAATVGGEARLGSLKALLERAGLDAQSGLDPFTGKASWLVEVPLASLQADRGGQGWSLVVSWPEAVALRPLRALGRRFFILYLALGGAALLFLNRSLNDLVTRPIARMVLQARRFTEGDFRDLGHPPEEAVEFRHLNQALHRLGRSLKGESGPAGDSKATGGEA